MAEDPVQIVKVNGQDKVVPTWALVILALGGVLAVGWWAGTMENRVGNIERMMQDMLIELRSQKAAVK